MNYFQVHGNLFSFLKTKIHSIGFKYSLVSSKKDLAICLLKQIIEHSRVTYFQSKEEGKIKVSKGAKIRNRYKSF